MIAPQAPVPTSPDVLVPDNISADSLPADSRDVAGLQSPNRPGLIKTLVVVATIACILLVLWTIGGARSDPYSRQTLALQGSAERGSQLFLLNCAGCHGIAAQGLVGPRSPRGQQTQESTPVDSAGGERPYTSHAPLPARTPGDGRPAQLP